LNFINDGKHMMEIDGLKITLSQIKAEFKKIFKNVFFSENELVGSKFLIDKNLWKKFIKNKILFEFHKW